MPEARRFSTPSRTAEWEPKLKQYPHFDAPISMAAAEALCASPSDVARHQFLPFLKFVETWQPFRRKKGERGPKPPKKSRTIRYASHRDSIIYSYYRHNLSKLYEESLEKNNLGKSVLAYRRVVDKHGRGKSNINFARDAFDAIANSGDCVAIALDISGFFDSLDHVKLREKCAAMIKADELPNDHAKVYENITAFADVDRDQCYVALGFAERIRIDGRFKIKSKIPRKEIPIQLCDFKKFRNVIANPKRKKSLISKNKTGMGVPQGAPISDLLANIYMLEFDRAIQSFVEARSGTYFRYSDDILIVVPTSDASLAIEVENFVAKEVKNHGENLVIKPTKTQSYFYYKDVERVKFKSLRGKAKNGLEYLGFRYDGKRSYIKDSTLSRLYRNITVAARQAAHAHVARYQGHSYDQLIARFDFGGFQQRFGRVENFQPNSDPKGWTFWTYVQRAKAAMGPLGEPISDQLRKYKAFSRRTIEREIAKALERLQTPSLDLA